MEAAAERLTKALDDRYLVERELGRGGMATVYLARDLRYQRQVAIKVLSPELAAAIGPGRFLREIQIAARLQHPHILPVFDSGDTEGVVWYAMPFAEGESLRERLTREGALPIESAVQVVREVADALDYAHAQGIVHRDIKPENIMLSRGHALVADFGIARAVGGEGGALTATGMAIGTPAYMSPEQTAATREVDGRADVYSLGCVVYEMLTGEPPYTGPTPHSIIAKRMTDPIPAPRRLRPAIPRPIDAAVTRALALTPADRFPTAGAMAQALARPESIASTRLAGLRFPVLVLLGVLVLGAAAALLLRRDAGPARPTAPVLTVLPFRNLGEPGDQYFAAGLAEEITARLASLPGLVVRSRPASLKPDDRSPAAIGRDHGADYALSGSVRWERRPDGSSRIRVTPRLIRVQGEQELLGQTIDAALVDVFDVQRSIAERVTAALGLALAPPARARLAAVPTQRIDAWDHFVRGNYYLAQRTPDAVKRAIQDYQEAARLDSGFTRALARQAYGYTLFLDWGWRFEGRSDQELRTLARGLTDQALGGDSTSAEAWLSLAYLRVVEDPFRMKGATPAFERSLALDSTNAEAWYQFGQALMALGRDSAAAAAYHRALALEPERPMTLVPLSAIARNQGRLAEARKFADSAVGLVGMASPYARVVRGNLVLAAGDPAGAIRDAEVALATDSSYPVPARSLLVRAYAARGDTARAVSELERALGSINTAAPSSTDARFLAVALIALGRMNEAVQLIERVRPRGGYLWFYLTAHDFDPLRTDPRFHTVFSQADPRRPDDPR